MNEQPQSIPSVQGDTRPTRLWYVIAIVAIAIVISTAVLSYYRAEADYRSEQQAIRDFQSQMGDRTVQLIASHAADEEGNASDDTADAEIQLTWVAADWLRGPINALGDPIYERVREVTIYDPDVNDTLIESLSKFTHMTQLKVSGAVGISRDGFKDLNEAVPTAKVWIEHDDDRFMSSEEERDEDEDDDDSEGE